MTVWFDPTIDVSKLHDIPTVKEKPWLKLIAKNKNGKTITATLPKSDPYSKIYYRMDTW